ncbi:MAG: RNA polymerase sigma factor [Pseudobacter sp.]|uniref:RNA polymerase sigma factor n=1 Tax=Pseudobacter sp. TaxID=2045420 RepID=UPI003F800C1F
MPTNLSQQERELLSLVADGDQLAFKDLYHLYSGKVFSFARLYLKDELIVEDLVQMAFIRCWERREELRNIQSFKDFLFILTRNLVFDHLRKMTVQVKRLEDIRLQSLRTAGTGYEYNPLDTKELRDLHARAILELPAQQKEVYQRHTEQDESLDEIAEEMNIARATVKKHLEVARKSVRAYILRHSSAFVAALYFISTKDSHLF